MFDIYIKNFNRNGSLVQTETLIQTIPAASEGGLRLISPQIKNEMGNAESFDFSIEPGTPFYDAFLQMKTMIRVEYDGDNIFFGRVLTVENNRFSGTRKIRCEGAISLLMDSPVKGVKEASRSKISTYSYISSLISNHNDYLGEDDKHFVVGQVPGNYSGVNSDQQLDSDTRKFGSDSWSDTKSALEDLRSHFGGYFRTRTSRIGNGIYLDWLDNYFSTTTNAQTVEVSKNILDISDITEVDNIFTVLVPLGTYQSSSTSSDGSSSSSSSSSTDNTMYIDGTYLPVPDILNEFSYDELNRGYHRYEDYANSIRRYGAIFKTVQFSNATSKSDLRDKACEWIKDNYYGEVVKYTIKAIDMRQIGQNTSKIMVGDLVRLVYPVIKEDGTDYREEKTRTCMSVTYDLYHPENNSYTFGIPANILTSMYGISNTSSVSSNSTSAGGNGGTAEEKSSDPWALIRDWLADHKMYYDWETWGNSYFPWKKDYDGVNLDGKHMHSPNSNYEYLYSAGRYIYKFSYTIDSWYDGQTYKELLSLEGAAAALDYKREHYVWRYTIDTSNKYIDEDNYVEILQDYNIREYVLMEYGFDLLAWSGAGENGTITSGNETYMTIIDRILDPASGINIPILKVGASIVKGATNLIDTINESPLFKWAGFKLDPFDLSIPSQNEQPESYTDAEGTLHWYYEDPKNPGTYVETTNRSLNLMAVNSDNFIGTMVTQDYADADGNIHTYKFGQGIEEWAHGELVVAHVEGDLTYIGGRDSMYTAQTSLQHMDNICGDFTYETDEDGIQYVNINSAGGMRITSAKKDDAGNPIVGPDGKYITAEFGVFDDNTLKGGIIVDKLNNDEYDTKIIGTKVDIRADQMASIGIWTNDKFDAGVIIDRINEGVNADDDTLIPSTRIRLTADQALVTDTQKLSDWLDARGEKIDATSGLLADTITAYNGRFANIEADYITSKNIQSTIGSLDYVTIKSTGYISTPKVKISNTEYSTFSINFLKGAGNSDISIDCLGAKYNPGPGVSINYRNIGLVAEELTGADAGKIKIRFTEGSSSTPSQGTGHDGNGGAVFNIAATAKYKTDVAAAWNGARSATTIPTTDIGKIDQNLMTIKFPKSYSDYHSTSGDNRFVTYNYSMQLTSFRPQGSSSDLKCIDLKSASSNGIVARLNINADWTNQYNSGWNGARNKMSWTTASIGSGSSSSISISVPQSNGSSSVSTYSYSMSLTSYRPSGTTSDLKCVNLTYGGNNNVVARLDINSAWNDRYNSGWNGARNKMSWTTASIGSGTSSSISVSIPQADGSSNVSTYSYSMALTSYRPSGTTSDLKCINLTYGGNNNVVARLDINSDWNDRYNSGWNGARNKMSWPSASIGSNFTSSMSISIPRTNGASATDSYSYSMALTSHTISGTTTTKKCVELKYGGNNNIVARLDINSAWNDRYNDGKKAGLSEYYDSGYWSDTSTLKAGSNVYIPNRTNTGQKLWFTIPSGGGGGSYSLSFEKMDRCGSDQWEAATAGYDTEWIDMTSSQQSTYRLLKFKVDGHKMCFGFT